MNVPMLKTYVELALQYLPWERVGAMVGSLILSQAKAGKPDILAKVKRYISKARAQLAVLEAALADDLITTEEAQAVMSAWADGAPTPAGVEAKVGA